MNCKKFNLEIDLVPTTEQAFPCQKIKATFPVSTFGQSEKSTSCPAQTIATDLHEYLSKKLSCLLVDDTELTITSEDSAKISFNIECGTNSAEICVYALLAIDKGIGIEHLEADQDGVFGYVASHYSSFTEESLSRFEFWVEFDFEQSQIEAIRIDDKAMFDFVSEQPSWKVTNATDLSVALSDALSPLVDNELFIKTKIQRNSITVCVKPSKIASTPELLKACAIPLIKNRMLSEAILDGLN